MDENKETQPSVTETNPPFEEASQQIDFSFMADFDKAEPKAPEVSQKEPEQKKEPEAPKETSVEAAVPSEQQKEQPKEIPPVKLAKETLEDIKAIVAPAPAKQEEKPYTVEDLYKETLRPVLTDKIMEALDAAKPTEKAAIFQNLFDQVAKHALLLARIDRANLQKDFDRQISELRQQITPVVTKQQEADYRSLEEAFYEQNSDLKQHSRIVNLAAKELASSPEVKQIKDPIVGMKLVADRTREILKASGIDLSSTGVASATPPANLSAPTRTSSVPKAPRNLDGGRSQGQTVTTSGQNFDWMNDR